jgi:hypothetical protein
LALVTARGGPSIAEGRIANCAGRMISGMNTRSARQVVPDHNNFQHATYSRTDPAERVRYQDFVSGAAPDSLAWRDAMARVGHQLAEASVKAILFVSGSPLGSDLFGAQRLDDGIMKRGYSRGIPGLDALLALMREQQSGDLPRLPGGLRPPFDDQEDTRRLLDQQASDMANFTGPYVDLCRNAINRDTSRPIACARYLWSSEHHHLGRALAAWCLIDRLKALTTESALATGDRVLLFAHGHAGAVIALLSNLLMAGASSSRKKMLDMLGSYAPLDSGHPPLQLEELNTALEAGQLLNGAAFDVVTLGTPVRYGWETSSIGKLLHIVNHRPMRQDGKRWLAKMELPQITIELPYATGGDYVQQLAVAGTDAVPGSPEAQAVNRALWELLEPYDGFERWLECARKGVRCANDGLCLLVDYQDADTTPTPTPARHLFGHAAYTRLNAMLFNTTETVRSLYAG